MDIWPGRRGGATVGRMSAALIVAEPEAETRGFLERQLADDGFDVLGASHPGEVFDLAERLRPDLVLVAELELCTRLRDGEPGRSWNRDVPVILLGREWAGVVRRWRGVGGGRGGGAARPGDVLGGGEIRIDRPTRCVQVAGRRLLLPAKEFELLAKL